MPANQIKHDAREGKGTVKSLEKKWDRAKDAAGKKGGEQNWALTNHIYQNMKKSKGSAEDKDLSIDNGLGQPGVTIPPSDANKGGSGAGSSVMSSVKLNAATRIKQVRLQAAGEKWSGDVKTKKHPPEGLFKDGSAEDIARWAHSSHDDLGGAMSSLNFYVNRAGDSLSPERKKAINTAKDKLSEMYK